MLSVLLALGPLFILLTLFDATRRLFDAWIHELTNYGLVSVLTVMVTTLLLDLLRRNRPFATVAAFEFKALKPVCKVLKLVCRVLLKVYRLHKQRSKVYRMHWRDNNLVFQVLTQLTKRIKQVFLALIQV